MTAFLRAGNISHHLRLPIPKASRLEALTAATPYLWFPGPGMQAVCKLCRPLSIGTMAKTTSVDICRSFCPLCYGNLWDGLRALDVKELQVRQVRCSTLATWVPEKRPKI